MDDVCVEFEITPNRPDCLAVRGLAREAAATFGVPFLDHEPQVKPGHGDVNRFLKVDIENPGLCYRYVGAVVENVRVKPSPRWMRERLRAVRRAPHQQPGGHHQLCHAGIRPAHALLRL